MDDTSRKITVVLGASRQIYRETSHLMEAIDGQVTASGYECPYNTCVIWDASRLMSSNWQPSCVTRFWQKQGAAGKALGLLVNIELMRDEEGKRFWFEDVGPVVKAIVLTLSEPVKNSEWRFAWRDGVGHDSQEFRVTNNGPLYRSTPKKTAGTGDLLLMADNFWLPLTALTNEGEVDVLLVKPMTRISEKGIAAGKDLVVPPYLLLPAPSSPNLHIGDR